MNNFAGTYLIVLCFYPQWEQVMDQRRDVNLPTSFVSFLVLQSLQHTLLHEALSRSQKHCLCSVSNLLTVQNEQAISDGNEKQQARG